MHIVTEIVVVTSAVFNVLALILIAVVQISSARKRKRLRVERQARVDSILRDVKLGINPADEFRWRAYEHYGLKVTRPDNTPIVTEGWTQP